MPITRLLQELYVHPRSALRLVGCARDLSGRLGTGARDLILGGEFRQLYRTVRPYTMSSRARLHGLHDAVRFVVEQDISGDLVECGTARGGSAALMGLTLSRMNASRTLWVFDTFQGLPPPTD